VTPREPRTHKAAFAVRALAGLALAASASAPVRADTNAWIQGTAEFLVDRANSNFLYIFQNNLRDNRFFQDYFPATRQLVARNDLRALLADRTLIHDALDQDIAAFLASRISQTADRLIKETPQVSRLKQAAADAATAMAGVDPKKEHPETRKLEAIRKALDALPPLACGLEAAGSGNVAQAVQAIRCEIGLGRQLAQDLRTADDARGWGDGLTASVASALGNSDAAKNFKAEWDKLDPARLRHLLEITAALQRISDQYRKVQTGELGLAQLKKSNTLAIQSAHYLRFVIDALDLVELSGYVDESLRKRIEANSDFDDFRRYAQFFAQLASAASAANTSDPAEVKALLASISIPDVSFGVKRESNNFKWLITAYLGGSANWQVRPRDAGHTTVGMTAPIGLELAWGRRGLIMKCDYEDIVEHRCQHSSLSVLLSPIDFGVPVAMQMAGVEGGVKLSDIVAPGLYVVYGVKNYPLAVGLGLVRGRSLEEPETNQKRVVLFIGFDLPLYVLK
jgi:hypothetical protein